MKRTVFFLLLLLLVSGLGGCRKKSDQQAVVEEDHQAKRMLQGIWVDEDEQDVAFKAQGDTIFYPDSTSQPVYFQIVGDTLVLHSANLVKYPILRQTVNLFIFRNQNGDEVKCVKSTDPDDATFFSRKAPTALNQGKLIKRDTVVMYNGGRYHCYVQVNPTTYKVIKASYNDDGVEVDNVYYDNIINLNVYHGAKKLFSGDFRKQQFAKVVPRDFLQQSILSDFTFIRCDGGGIHYIASLVIPDDGQSSYLVEITVSYSGRMTMKVNK